MGARLCSRLGSCETMSVNYSDIQVGGAGNKYVNAQIQEICGSEKYHEEN